MATLPAVLRRKFPEQPTVAAIFLQAAHQYANDMPVWVTELGYDINQGSPFKAIPIGNKTALQTQADWILRSSLLYERTGIERIFFYDMYDDNVSNPLQFSSSGLINADKTRKPAADYIYQVNKLFGNYIYQSTIKSDPVVDLYKSGNNTAYVIVVPDEKGRTSQYTLDLGTVTSAKIYTPKIGSDTMGVQLVTTANGKLNVTATETPVFIVPVANGTNNSSKEKSGFDNLMTEQNIEPGNEVQVYPNPSTDVINIVLNTKSSDKVQIKISEAGSGRVFKNIQFNKAPGYFYQAIDIHSLSVGYYLVEIRQGHILTSKKFMKKQ